MEKTERKSILKNRNFVLTALGAVVSNVGAIFYNFVVSFWILELTGNDSVIQGLYLGVTGLFFVLASPIGGVICDRFHKGKILWICDFARAATILLTILSITLVKSDVAIIVILFVGGVIGNIIGALFAPAGAALIPEVVAVEDLQKANSVAGITTAIQTIIGTTLVGVLYSLLPMKVILYGVAGLYAISGLTEIFIRYRYEKRAGLSVKAALSDMRETLGYIRKEKAVFVLLLLIVFLNLFYNPIQSNFFSYFCVTDVASTPDFFLHGIFSAEIWQSVFCVCLSVASIVTAVVLSKKQLKKPFRAMRTGFILIAFAVAAMALSYFFLVRIGGAVNSFLVINSAVCLVIGAGVVTVNVPVASTLQLTVERDKFGKVMSFLQVGAQGLTPLMVFLSGVLLKAGAHVLLFVLAAGLIVTTLIAYFSKSLKTGDDR